MDSFRTPSAASSRPGSVCIVGAGLAGAQTCAALRRHGFTGRITVLGAEGLPPYDRPPLSKELFTRREPSWLAPELDLDLTALADDLWLADPAVALNCTGATPAVLTASGRTIAAEVIVFACGAVPLRPADWTGVLTLHTAADAAALRDRLDPGARLVVIGAGWIGAEVAGVATASGVKVTVIEATATPLSRQLGELVGAQLTRWYDAAGVTLVTRATVTAASGRGVTIRRAVPNDGTSGGVGQDQDEHLAADVVLAAVGARPATDWLRSSGLPLDERGAILVDQDGAVRGPAFGAPTWYAVGDCATRTDAVWQQVPGGHWSTALLDPDNVARSILGLPPQVVPAPYVFSAQLGHHLALFGRPDPTLDRVVLRGDPGAETGWAACYFRGDTEIVTGILVVDSPREVAAARRLLAAGPTRLDLASVADPEVPLKLSARSAEFG